MKVIEPAPTDETTEWHGPSGSAPEPREAASLRSATSLPTLLGAVDLVAASPDQDPEAALSDHEPARSASHSQRFDTRN